MASTVWSGHLTFGLVSFPIKLTTAARRRTIDFDLLHRKDQSRVRYVTYCAEEDQPLQREEIVKGFAYEKDRYVILEAEDFAKASPKTAKVMEIQEFVSAQEVDPVYLNASYYLAPDEGGEKPYALLYHALGETQLWGIAKLTMHSREHTVVIRPAERGLLLHTMFYQDEIRGEDEFPTDERAAVQEKELELANSLVGALSAPFDPGKYHDAYRERLESIIESKRRGKKIVAMPAPKIAPVSDLMEALQRSLAQKGAATEKKPIRKAAATKTLARRAR